MNRSRAGLRRRLRSSTEFPLGTLENGEILNVDFWSLWHLIIGGMSGTGKTSLIRSIISSLASQNSPTDLQLILVDPKGGSFDMFTDSPYLERPILSAADETKDALVGLVDEMEHRYELLADTQTKNIEVYNTSQKERMPYIVFVIDEVAGLGDRNKAEYERLFLKLAQKSRAVGIHMILCAERPVVGTISGLTKANIPSRIAFKTKDNINSRVIIDRVGAEKLEAPGEFILSYPGNNWKGEKLRTTPIKDE